MRHESLISVAALDLKCRGTSLVKSGGLKSLGKRDRANMFSFIYFCISFCILECQNHLFKFLVVLLLLDL